MKVGYDGRTYSDSKYSNIVNVAKLIFNKISTGNPLNTSGIFWIKEYKRLSKQERVESLIVLCKKFGAKKLKFRNKSGPYNGSFYAARLDDIKLVSSSYEFISEIKVKTLSDRVCIALKGRGPLNITDMCSAVWGFKVLNSIERMNFINSLESCGIINTIREKIKGIDSVVMLLPNNKTKETNYSEPIGEEMKAKTKSEELIEQANKLLAAAEEAKKEEEKQLSKHELMNIQREINVEIIEMEKQIDGMIDSFSKLKNLFDKLKQ